ncbi:MAG: lipopolysaccharide heptosyltransferase I [Thermodesulfobacteriota bacterium]|nr:lipopolysaccharide heptosyltransferase I [Thermodesulfobacteriota bacterium]
MDILIVKVSSIGDVIHTLPALNALRAHFPDARITWLVEEAASALVTSHPAVDRVLVLKRRRWRRGLLGPSGLKNAKELFHFVAELRDTTYDLVIDFQGLMKSAVMVGLCRGKRKIGYDRTREWSHLVLDERIEPYDRNAHAIHRYLNLIRHLNVDTSEIVFEIPYGKKEMLRVQTMLHKGGWSHAQPIVAMNPVARWETKLWGAWNFAHLADRLITESGCLVVFTGGRADSEEISKIRSMMKCGYMDLSGRTDLRELAALYERSTCVVSTDTGPMHLAAAIETPVVALFGPTAPWRTGPFGEGHQAMRSDISCSPCFKRRCDSVACMRNISVSQVFDSVAAILKRS